MTKLEWCREHAPEHIKEQDDVVLLAVMNDSYERLVLSAMNFVDIVWSPYNRLSVDLKNNQVRNLFGTSLCEPNNGVEFCFIPTFKMKELEEGILNAYSKLVVEPHTINICNEVFYTTKLEGAKTTIARTQEIHDGASTQTFSEEMVKSSFNATKYLSLFPNKMSIDIILVTWNVLIENCCCNEDIRGNRFRIGNVQVGNHVGLNHELVEDAMELWVKYYNSSILSNHPFIKAALLHFAFEYIHPFCDGNGRLGRLLMYNFLINSGYDKLRAVSISHIIDRARYNYDYAFSVSENVYTDCTYFIEYMLEVFLKAIEECLCSEVNMDYTSIVNKCNASSKDAFGLTMRLFDEWEKLGGSDEQLIEIYKVMQLKTLSTYNLESLTLRKLQLAADGSYEVVKIPMSVSHTMALRTCYPSICKYLKSYNIPVDTFMFHEYSRLKEVFNVKTLLELEKEIEVLIP